MFLGVDHNLVKARVCVVPNGGGRVFVHMLNGANYSWVVPWWCKRPVYTYVQYKQWAGLNDNLREILHRIYILIIYL